MLFQDLITAISTFANAIKDRLQLLDLNKVDKVAGQGLTDNNFTDAHREAIEGLGTAASRQITVSSTPLPLRVGMKVISG